MHSLAIWFAGMLAGSGTTIWLLVAHLSPEVVQKIRESDKSYLEIATEFGIYFGRVAKIRRGETWKCA